MLDLIRKKQKSVIVKLVFWGIIATFVGTIFLVWGKGSDGTGQDPTLAATVNDDRISYNEYQRIYSQLYNLYREMYREQFTPAMEEQLGLQQQAMEMLIDQTLLLQEADRMDIEVSRKELVDEIARIPAFQDNGAFSKDRYLQVLAYQRMNPEEFEAMQKRQMRIEKVRQRLQKGIEVSPAEIEEEYREQNEKVNLEFLRLTPALFESRVVVDDEALQEWFADKRENFREPEKAALQFIRFDPERYKDDVVLQDGDLEKYYRRHLDRFEVPEQAKASHILIQVPENAGDEMRTQKRELAEKVLGEVRSGKDFSALARQYSDDPGSASKGGELGYFPRGTMVAPFEEAAFALQPGEISDIVETPFGFHIIQKEEHVDAGVKPLSEVTDEVRAGALAETSRQIAFEKAMDAYNINRRDGSLEAAAEANDLPIEETGFFARGEAVGSLGPAPELSAAAFTLEPGDLARPLILPEGVILASLKERRESRLPELAEVREQAEAAYRAEKARELARKAAEEALARLREGDSAPQVAQAYGTKAEETGPFTRAYGAFIPKLGSAEDLAETAFNLTSDNPVPAEPSEQDGRFIAARLKDRQEADMEALDDAGREQLRQSLVQRKQNEVLEKTLESLRQSAEISIAPALASNSDQGAR